MVPLDYSVLYEQKNLWSWDYLADPYYSTKVRLIQGMIPHDVKTILDVGCGNGAIANALGTDYWVVSGDRSQTALCYVQNRPVRLSADFLPFQNRSFDVVMSHEVLEHLPEEIFQQAVSEIMRVARRYMCISIPYRDRLRQQCACCAECGCKYNVWGHIRSFHSVQAVRQLFPDFSLRVHTFCGRENEYMSPPARWICQWIGGKWAINEDTICPRCRSKSQYQAESSFRRAVAALTDRVDRLLPRRRAYWWLICLFERNEFTEGSDIVKLLEELKPPLNVQLSHDFQLKIMSRIAQDSKKSRAVMVQLKPFLWPFLLISLFFFLQILANFDIIDHTFVYNIREYTGAIFKWQK